MRVWHRLLCPLIAVGLSLPGSAAFALYDDGSRFAFVASPNENSVLIADLRNGTVEGSIAVEQRPGEIAASEIMKALVVSQPASDSLILVDLTSPDLDQYPYPLNISPDHIRLSPQGDTLAIYDREERVLEVQAVRRKETLLRLEDIDVSGDVTFNSDGLALYWVDNVAGTLNYSDLWSRRQSLALPGADGGLSPLTRSVDGALGFVSNATSGQVYVIELSDLSIQSVLEIGSDPGRPWGTANGRFMMVPDRTNGRVTAISMLDNTVAYEAQAVANPIAVNPGWGDTLVAVIGEKGEIAILDTDDGKVLERFHLEGTARAGVVTSDSRTLAVPLAGTGGLALFDLKTRELIHELKGLPVDLGELSLAINNNLCH